LYKLGYGDHDVDNANESKRSDSLHSSMPSLWGGSFDSMAAEIITTNGVANIVVQSMTQDDTLIVFCHHILTTIKPASSATSLEKVAFQTRPVQKNVIKKKWSIICIAFSPQHTAASKT
jgi:hypothetical protein